MTTPDVDVTDSDTPGAAFDIRRTVFIEEQGVSETVEFDDGDKAARHFVARVDGDPAGTARIRFPGAETAKVERVAVRPDYRGMGVGRCVMKATHEFASQTGRSRVVVHAQTRVEAFYESLGYETVGEVDDETDIPHVKMVRER